MSVVKYPLDLTWVKLRDNLPEIAKYLQDIDKIVEDERNNSDSNEVKITNIWYAAPKIPAVVKNYLKSDMFIWTDYADWDQRDFNCRWNIKPHAFSEYVNCKGVTSFESAIAGRGTKITFSGSLELSPGSKGNAVFGGIAFNLIESFIVKLIPNNFMKLTSALSAYMVDKDGRQT